MAFAYFDQVTQLSGFTLTRFKKPKPYVVETEIPPKHICESSLIIYSKFEGVSFDITQILHAWAIAFLLQ